MKRFLWWTFYTEEDLKGLKEGIIREISALKETRELDRQHRRLSEKRDAWYDGAITANEVCKQKVDIVIMIGCSHED